MLMTVPTYTALIDRRSVQAEPPVEDDVDDEDGRTNSTGNVSHVHAIQ